MYGGGSQVTEATREWTNNSQDAQTSKATIGLFIHAFYKYFLSVYYVLDTLLDAVGIEMINN